MTVEKHVEIYQNSRKDKAEILRYEPPSSNIGKSSLTKSANVNLEIPQKFCRESTNIIGKLIENRYATRN